MAKTFSFTARKIAPNTYAVREDSMLANCYFGTVELRRHVLISNSMGCASVDEAWMFIPNEEEMEGLVDNQIRLSDMLAEVRAMYVELWARWDAQAAAEMWAEGAWLRAAEYDQEAQDEMDREHMMGLT
jgi:hypothetical protein